VRRWFKNLIILFALLNLASCTAPHQEKPSSPFSNQAAHTELAAVTVTDFFGAPVEILDAFRLTQSERRARSAAVKVRPVIGDGHGSGTYTYMFERRVVITAAHVVDGATTMRIEARHGETVIGRVAMRDFDADIAFIVVPEIKSRTAIPYRPQLRYQGLVGTRLTYTGFPSHHDLLTIRGYIASLERDYIVTNMFGWFGSSGSGVYDQKGKLVGVVSGIDIGRFGPGFPIPLEQIIWVAPISKIDQKMLRIRIKTAPPVGILTSFPGAATPRRGETTP